MMSASEAGPVYREKTWIAVLTVCMFVCVIFIIVNRHVVRQNHEASFVAHSELYACERAAVLMRRGSDNLTNSARCYVVTGDPSYREAYFNEVHNLQNRDTSLSLLDNISDRDLICQYLNMAMASSRRLMDTDFHAMRLVTLDSDLKSSELAPEIRAYSLPAAELRMTPAERKKKAWNMLFCADYNQAKNKIYDCTDKALNRAVGILVRRRTSLEYSYEMMFIWHGIAVMVFAASVVALILLIRRRQGRYDELMRRFVHNLPLMFSSKDARTGRYIDCNRSTSDFFAKRGIQEVRGHVNSELFSEDEAAIMDASD